MHARDSSSVTRSTRDPVVGVPHGSALSWELRMSPQDPADAGASAGALLLRAPSRGMLAASENAESLMCCVDVRDACCTDITADHRTRLPLPRLGRLPGAAAVESDVASGWAPSYSSG